MSSKDLLAKVAAIANLPLAQFFEHIRCGFELETKKINGLEYYVLSRMVTDESAPAAGIGWGGRFMEERGGATFPELEKVIGLKEQLFEIVEDCTVTGGEIRTIGPRTMKQFSDSVKAAYKNQIEVDDRCSFHIHMSIAEMGEMQSMFTTKGKASSINEARELFLLHLREGLLSQINRVPATVLKRWSNAGWRESYFPLGISSTGRSFVSFSRHGTIEFRCFGNVENEKDAMSCLLIAARAMRFALRCLLLDEKHSLVSAKAFNETIRHEVNKILVSGLIPECQAGAVRSLMLVSSPERAKKTLERVPPAVTPKPRRRKANAS